MSNKKDDIKASLQNNSIIGGFIAPQQDTITSPKQSHTDTNDNKDTNYIKQDNNNDMEDIIKAGAVALIKGDKYKYKNNKNASNNYAITFKIDADLEQYLKNIEIITFIDTMQTGEIKSTTKNEYVNDLIRADLKRRLNISANENNQDVWINAFKKYCKKYGIKDKN